MLLTLQPRGPYKIKALASMLTLVIYLQNLMMIRFIFIHSVMLVLKVKAYF